MVLVIAYMVIGVLFFGFGLWVLYTFTRDRSPLGILVDVIIVVGFQFFTVGFFTPVRFEASTTGPVSTGPTPPVIMPAD